MQQPKLPMKPRIVA